MVDVCITGAQCFRWAIGSGGARQSRRVSRRLSGGGLPPYGPPSGAGLARGTRMVTLFTRSRVTPPRGGACAQGRQTCWASRRHQTGAGLRRSRGPAGRHGAWPVERLSCRRSTALRRHGAVLSTRSASARARRRSRIASSATCGTSPGGSAPERLRRAHGTASRRAGVTRSPACVGIRAGATTPPSSPGCVSSPARHEPQGPAASTQTRGGRCACAADAGLPSACVWCRRWPQGALAAGQLTPGGTGGQPTPQKS